VKRILKPAKEAWSNMTVHVREATRQRLGVVRKAADKQGIDLNAMMDQAVNEVFDEVLRPAGKASAFSNGNSSATTDGER
jgi:hypothetical protein